MGATCHFGINHRAQTLIGIKAMITKAKTTADLLYPSGNELLMRAMIFGEASQIRIVRKARTITRFPHLKSQGYFRTVTSMERCSGYILGSDIPSIFFCLKLG